jgi:hypothetical protein
MKVLVLCTHGKNRSRHLAEYLSIKGYEASYAGVGGGRTPELLRLIDEADVLVTVHPAVKESLQASDYDGKRLIELDVEDRPEMAHPDKRPLQGEEWIRFQELHVYPKLEKQVDKFLPL